MFAYYLHTAWRSCVRAPVLSALTVLAMGLGIGACMTSYSVLHSVGADPIPGKSEHLFNVIINTRDAATRSRMGEARQLMRRDAEALLREGWAQRQAAMAGGAVSVQVPSSTRPEPSAARYTSADFFALFEAPLSQGRSWSAAEDAATAPVAVLSAEAKERWFGTADALGQRLVVNGQTLRVIGVLAPWRPSPRFYDLSKPFSKPEDIYLPLSTAISHGFQHQGNMNCFGGALDHYALDAECEWLQYWVELGPEMRPADYLAKLAAYAQGLHAQDRYREPPSARLYPLKDWLDLQKVVPSELRLQLWLSLGFLLVCLVNSVGLLMSKSLRRSGEIALRRALGAPRRAIFAQFMVEALLMGLMGAALGLALSWLGLLAVRASPHAYAKAVGLNPALLALCLALALLASLLAALLPAWRAAQVRPALQLKKS